MELKTEQVHQVVERKMVLIIAAVYDNMIFIVMNNDNKPPSLITFTIIADGKLQSQLEWP